MHPARSVRPPLRGIAANGEDIDGEMALNVELAAYLATGEELPEYGLSIRRSDQAPAWDFDDRAEMARRLPKLTALYSD